MLLVDVSGSMIAPLSRRSEMLRTDAAYGLAVLLREIGEKVAYLQLLRRCEADSGAARICSARCDRHQPAAQRHVLGKALELR